jgi:hypothetical protein
VLIKEDLERGLRFGRSVDVVVHVRLVCFEGAALREMGGS